MYVQKTKSQQQRHLFFAKYLLLVKSNMAPDICCYCYRFFKFLANISYQPLNRSIYSNPRVFQINSVLDQCILPRYLGTGHFLLSEKKFQPIGKQGIVKKDGTVIKVKTKEEKQITLLDEKGSMSVLNMDAAKKLAEKKKLMLVDVTDEQRDGKSGRRVYQLKTEADALDFKRRSDKVDDKSKTKKMFLIKTNIADNDLESKINIMIRNVSKKHEVRVILTDENKSHNLESVYKKIEEKVQDTCHIKNKARKDQNRLAFELEPFSEKKKEKQKLKQTTAEENKNMDTVNNTKKAEAQS